MSNHDRQNHEMTRLVQNIDKFKSQNKKSRQIKIFSSTIEILIIYDNLLYKFRFINEKNNKNYIINCLFTYCAAIIACKSFNACTVHIGFILCDFCFL
jgi:hypothetical protein